MFVRLLPVCLGLVLVSGSGGDEPAPAKVGDKVWAQWRPNEWYPGKVDKKAPVGVHIAFDDGDQADCAPSVVATNVAPGKNTVKIGTRVLGLWTDNRMYPGWVSGTTDGMFDIQFDDGDTRALAVDDLRLLPVQTGAGRTAKVGDKVWAQWRPNAWFPGKVNKATKVGLFIDFDDGDKADVPICLVAVNRAPGKGTVKVGTRVLGMWTDNHFYPGTITKIGDDGYNVQFDDGDSRAVGLDDLRLLNE
jgi:hypothetical protein